MTSSSLTGGNVIILVYYLRRRRRLCLYFGLSVCLADKWKNCEGILTKFLGGVGHDQGTKGINFGDDLDHRPDPGVRSPKSGFTGISKKYLVDSDQSCIANLHCKNHSAIQLCWRSAEVCALWVFLVCLMVRLFVHHLLRSQGQSSRLNRHTDNIFQSQ